MSLNFTHIQWVLRKSPLSVEPRTRVSPRSTWRP